MLTRMNVILSQSHTQYSNAQYNENISTADIA